MRSSRSPRPSAASRASRLASPRCRHSCSLPLCRCTCRGSCGFAASRSARPDSVCVSCYRPHTSRSGESGWWSSISSSGLRRPRCSRALKGRRSAVRSKTALPSLEIFEKLSKVDRASLPDLASTVKLLVERVAHLAQALHRLDQSIDPAFRPRARRADNANGARNASPEAERQLSLLRRQRATLDELVQRRSCSPDSSRVPDWR